MIRDLRHRHNVKLGELALALGIAPSTLSRYETGKREWPAALLSQAIRHVDPGQEQGNEPHWEWWRHRNWWNSYKVETDAGQTWATVTPGYPDFYRRLNVTNSPSDTFKKHVRVDSALEACVYSELCEAGAQCAYISLAVMSFPHHPLVTDSREPLPVNRRAAFVFEDWILWPQVNMLVGPHRVRPDCLAYNGKIWNALEFDGPTHVVSQEQSQWDKKRAISLGFPTLRFSQPEILIGHLTELLRSRLS